MVYPSARKNNFSFFLFCVLFFSQISADIDPLPSWNEGIAKNKIIEFIKDTTEKGSQNYIPTEERIATFDQDGTLWVEQPMYTQFLFAIDRIKQLAPEHPEWKSQEPFASILAGNQEAMSKFTEEDVENIVAVTHSGMTIDAFHELVREWLKTAVHPRFKKPFTDLVYQPMLELLQLFRDKGFKTYIVSGGGQEFIRAFAEKVYKVPPEQVIGTTGKVNYEYRNGQPVLLKQPKLLFVGDITTFCSSGFTWLACPQLLLPILNSRMIQQDIAFNEIKATEASYAYQKTVLNALEESENALASFHAEMERSYCLTKAQDASKEAYELTHELYEKGFKDYVQVLVNQRSFLEAQEASLQSHVQLLIHYVSLYKTLGGGWEYSCCEY